MSTELQLVKGSALPRATSVGTSDDVFIIQAGVTKIARKELISASAAGESVNEIVFKDVITVETSLSYSPRPGAMLQKMIVVSGSGSVKIGTTPGAGDVLTDTLSGAYPIFDRIGCFVNNEFPIYFTGSFIAILFWVYPYNDNNWAYKAINISSQFSLSSDLAFIPAGFVLDSIVFIADTGDVKIGTTPGGGEVIELESSGDPVVYNFIGKHFEEGANLYFTGLFTAHLFLWDLFSTIKKVSSVLKNDGDSIAVPQNTVVDIFYISPSAPGAIKIGTTPGGGEILNDSSDGSDLVLTNIAPYFFESKTLYLTGINTLKLCAWNVF